MLHAQHTSVLPSQGFDCATMGRRSSSFMDPGLAIR